MGPAWGRRGIDGKWMGMRLPPNKKYIFSGEHMRGATADCIGLLHFCVRVGLLPYVCIVLIVDLIDLVGSRGSLCLVYCLLINMLLLNCIARLLQMDWQLHQMRP